MKDSSEDNPSLPCKKRKLSEEAPSLHYDQAHQNFTREGLPQLLQLFLRNISASPQLPVEYKHIPFLKLLEEVASEFLMNELEAALWGILLQKTVFGTTFWTLCDQLLFSAFAAKKLLNSDLSVLEQHIMNKYTDFPSNYSFWVQYNQEKLLFSPQSLNSKYLELSTPISASGSSLLDYNYYVDEILQIAPQSASVEKEHSYEVELSQVKEEEEELKLPELMTLNSVLNEATSDIPVLFKRNFSFNEHLNDCYEAEALPQSPSKFRTKSEEEVTSPLKISKIKSEESNFND